jgi:hypothetical protein
MTRIRSLLTKAIAAAAISGAFLAAAPAASASANTGDVCKLTIEFLGFNQYRVTVGCTLANGNFPIAVNVDLYGSDSFFDDHLYHSLTSQFVVLGNVLDEDLGTDEVYAQAHITDRNNAHRDVRSNQVEGNF